MAEFFKSSASLTDHINGFDFISTLAVALSISFFRITGQRLRGMLVWLRLLEGKRGKRLKRLGNL